jgi:hypothetical protein
MLGPRSKKSLCQRCLASGGGETSTENFGNLLRLARRFGPRKITGPATGRLSETATA